MLLPLWLGTSCLWRSRKRWFEVVDKGKNRAGGQLRYRQQGRG